MSWMIAMNSIQQVDFRKPKDCSATETKHCELERFNLVSPILL
jgi:hypothetical protein